MGRLLQTVAKADASALQPFKALDKIQMRLDLLAGQPAMDTGILKYLNQQFALRAENLMSNTGTIGMIHGDFQPGNILVVDDNPDSDLVLIDLDTTCQGPLMWDLTLLEDRCLRGQYTRIDFEDVLAGYDLPIDQEVLLNACLLRDLHGAVQGFCELFRLGTPETAFTAATRYSYLVQPRPRHWNV